MIHPMYGPNLKLERAEYHINELEAVFREYVAQNSEILGADKDSPVDRQFINALPEVVPAIIGDAVHNIRVSLDHAYWNLVQRNRGVFTRNVKFPFGGDPASIKGSLNGQPETSKPAGPAIEYIVDELQPFPNGKFGLYDVNALDITDKHQLLLPTLVSILLTETINIRLFSKGAWIDLVGPNNGAKLMGTISSSMFLIRAGAKIEYTGDLQDGLTILFGEGPMNQCPVIFSLRQLLGNTRLAVAELTKFMI